MIKDSVNLTNTVIFFKHRSSQGVRVSTFDQKSAVRGIREPLFTEERTIQLLKFLKYLGHRPGSSKQIDVVPPD